MTKNTHELNAITVVIVCPISSSLKEQNTMITWVANNEGYPKTKRLNAQN
jgi:hypothetical protein